MATNDIEIAPLGTRALLTELGKALREDAERVVTAIRAREDSVPEGETSTAGPEDARLAEERNRYARLVGRVEALLAGWEE